MTLTLPQAAEACAREPIHIPGAVQPYGTLLTFEEEGQRILQVSANVPRVLGQTAEQWLGRSLSAALGLEGAAAIREALRPAEPESPVRLEVLNRLYDGVLHRTGGVAVLELEPAVEAGDAEVALQQHRLSRTIGELQRAESLPRLCEITARAVAEATGFDRVMVYRFDRDWHGEVIAEVKAEGLEPYLGLHYPASDIPEQARKLYERNWLRLIVEVDYAPVQLLPVQNPVTGAPLDLTLSVWRSVSPVHLEYLRNMGVGSSMSVSLLREGRIWGLIACHHRTRRSLTFLQRTACQLIGQTASMQIAAQESAAWERARHAQRAVQTRFFEHLARADRFVEALLRYSPELLETLQSTGAAVVAHGRCELLGQAPEVHEVRRILTFIQAQSPEPVFQTRSLSTLEPAFKGLRPLASGVLAVALSELRSDWILWFRPEVATTVRWAGRPEKVAEADSPRLHPRTSFAAWEESVHGQSLPWREVEVSAALELRAAIGANILKRYDQLRDQNAELEVKNSDLDSFAYIAAHDLKEPLRGMRNFAEFVLEDNADQLDEESRRKLSTVVGLGDRLRDQLDALLNFSRLGRKELDRRPVESRNALGEALEMLESRITELHPLITIGKKLPAVLADGTMLREVFLNLISNALKYSQPGGPRVEIGSGPAARTSFVTLFVRDEGIGIAPEQQQEVFRIFRRLHARDEYGGGTGVGLAIVKSIVERHGGEVRVESAPGAGSTFSFTLPRAAEV